MSGKVKSLFSFIFLSPGLSFVIFSFGLSSSSLGSSINTGFADTTSVAYHRERFEFFRSMFIDNYSTGDTEVLEYACRQSLYHGLRVPVDSFRIAIILLNLGSYTIGTEESEALSREALRWAMPDQHASRARIFNNLGYHFYKRLEIDSAFKYYNLSVRECDMFGDPGYAVKNNLVQFYQWLGYYNEADIVLSSLAFSLRRQFPDNDFGEDSEPAVYLTILSNMVANSLALDRMAEAEGLGRQIADVLTKNKFNRVDHSLGIAAMAQVKNRQGQINEASELFSVAFDELRNGGIDVESSRAMTFVISYGEFLVEHPEISLYRREVISCIRKLRAESAALEKSASKNSVLGHLYVSTGDLDSASYFLSLADSWTRQTAAPIRRLTANLNVEKIGIDSTVKIDPINNGFWPLSLTWIWIGLSATSLICIVGYLGYRVGKGRRG